MDKTALVHIDEDFKLQFGGEGLLDNEKIMRFDPLVDGERVKFSFWIKRDGDSVKLDSGVLLEEENAIGS